jgi:hypothetical protein
MGHVAQIFYAISYLLENQSYYKFPAQNCSILVRNGKIFVFASSQCKNLSSAVV